MPRWPNKPPKPPKPPIERLYEKIGDIKARKILLARVLHYASAKFLKSSFGTIDRVADIFNALKINPLPGRDRWDEEDISLVMTHLFKP